MPRHVSITIPRFGFRLERRWRVAVAAAAVALSVGTSVAVAAAAPAITRQPVDVQVTAGQNATFTVAASGQGAVTYQWRHSGFPISGATSTTFVLGGVNRGQAGFYDVVATDADGVATSTTATLTVAPRQYPDTIAPDPAFSSPMETDLGGAVTAIAQTPDGGYVVAGTFARVGGQGRSMILRVKADHTLDTGFVPPTIIGTKISTVAVQPDGKIIIGGVFSRVGYFTRNALARLNADGSVDTAFNPASSAMANVSSVLVQPDKKIVVAAWPYPLLLRLNPDGSLDRQLAPEVTGTVNAMAMQPDGSIVAVGALSANIADTKFERAVRITAQGVVDTTFRMATYGGVLSAVTIARNGRIFVGGSANSGPTETAFVGLTASGERDPAFFAQVKGTVSAIAEQPDGQVIIGGDLYQVDGESRRNLARLGPDGVVDSFPLIPPANPVRAILVLADGSVLLGGDDAVSGVVRHGLARYTANGGLELQPYFMMHGGGTANVLARLPDGKYMVFGRTEYAGSSKTRNVLRLNADATLDSWFSSNQSEQGSYLSIVDAAALPDGRVAVAVDNSGGSASVGVKPPVALIASDGSIDRTFVPERTSLGNGVTVAVLPNGKVAVAGLSTQTNVNPPAGVAVYNLDGSLDRSFAGGTPFDAPITTMAALSDGRVLVGGYFANYNGTPTGGLVRLKADGALDPTFAPTPKFSAVYGVKAAANGQLYVLAYPLQNAVTPSELVRLNANGTLDTTFQSAVRSIDSFVVQEDGKVIVRSVDYSSLFSSRVPVRLNVDGSVDATFAAVGILPAKMANAKLGLLREDGQLMYLDGTTSAKQLFATAATRPPVVSNLPAAMTVSLGGSATIQPTVASAIPAAYQWYLNGTAISGATNSTYTVAGFNAAKVGKYTVKVTNDLGSVTSPAVEVSAPLDTRGHIVNLSIRSVAGSGSDALIVGFFLGGDNTGGAKALLYRAVGPTLATTFNMTGALADPVLELYDASSFKIDQNDDWNGVYDFASVGAFPFAGAAPKDAAIYNPFAANGGESMHVAGKAGATGIALAEIYDTTPDGQFTMTTPRFINGSARTRVGTGDDVLILGFVVGGQSNVRLLVRGVGPTLGAAPYNIPGVLSDPKLEVYDASHAKIAENDNWADNGAGGSMAAAFSSVSAFPLASTTSKDAAVVLTLSPGIYSAVVRGAAAQTGVALVELYQLP